MHALLRSPLVRYLLVATPLCVLLFLWLADFFASWDGHAVSRWPTATADPSVYQVLIVEEDEDTVVVDWPASVVEGLGLPIDATGIGPNIIDPEAPPTRKFPFTLTFDLGEPTARRELPTTSARAVSGAVLAWVLGLALFNMWRSGSPFSWERRTGAMPAEPKADLQIARDGAAPPPRAQPGPPPPKRRRGGGRRR